MNMFTKISENIQNFQFKLPENVKLKIEQIRKYYYDILDSETYKTYGSLLLPVAVLLSVVFTILFCHLLWKLFFYTQFFQVLGWIFAEMLWVILSWGLVAAICYFALNHLGSSSEANHTSSTFGSLNVTSTASGNSQSPTTSSSINEWSNEIVSWLYSNFHKVPAPLDAWIKSLNEAAKKVTSPTKCEVLFEGFGDHSDVLQPPKISNVRVEHGPRDHLTVRSNIHLPCVRLRLVSSQRTPERMIVSNYDAAIVDLHGEIECRIACIANQLYLMGCFSGRPEMDIELVNTDPNAQYQVSIPMVEESIRRCLLSAVTNINLSEELPEERNTFADTFSRTIYNPPTHSPTTTTRNSYNAYDANLNVNPYSTNINRDASPTQVPEMFKKLNESHLISPSFNSSAVPNKLRVKVIKAARLGKDVVQPFVSIEMDEPAQKYTTTKGINANPYWEESFDFDLTPATEEILFEVYEGSDKLHVNDDECFLGLAIVNFDEIRRSGESLHNLKLQGRPYRKDAVSGEVTTQFDFYYDPNVITTGKITDKVKVTNPNGSEFRETLTTHRRPIYDPHDNYDGAEPIQPSKTTTVVVKTVSQTLKERPTIQSVHGSMENAIDPATQRMLVNELRNHNDPKHRELEAKLQSVAKSMSANNTLERQVKNNGTTSYHEKTLPNEFHEELDARQSRSSDRNNKKPPSEKRDRSFFGELKDRLSGRRGRSAKRSKSMDLDNQHLEEAVSLPPSRDVSKTRYAVNPEGTDRYRETYSVGARSGESTKSLYQHSTLILEMDHDKQAKYFLIPPAMLTEPAAARLMRKGKKLHIYNDHTFVAVKIKGGANCNVCQQRIRSSFSKQAYQCRDCKMVCHKSCHYKTDAFCTQSTVSKLQIAKDVDWAHFLSHYQLEEFISTEGL